jgi:proline iminopeptidase
MILIPWAGLCKFIVCYFPVNISIAYPNDILFMRKLLVLLVFCTTQVAGQTSYFITSFDGTRLFVNEFGKGQPLVLLAGGPGLDAVYIKSVWEHLQSNNRCIVLDQRATGKSGLNSIDSATASVDAYAKDIEALRQHLKLDQLTLVGHILGWDALNGLCI